MNNRWNRLVYRLWAPFYDRLILQSGFAGARRKALDLLELQRGETVIIVGVGTGADLPLLPEGVDAKGIDLSEAMLRRARVKVAETRARVNLCQGDAEDLPFADHTFDAAILILILSVVPDSRRCLQETSRVLRPGGRVVVFDKFLPPDSERPPFRRRILNLITRFFGTDINRSFEEMAAGMSLKVLVDEPGFLSGFYRTLLLEKENETRVHERF